VARVNLAGAGAGQQSFHQHKIPIVPSRPRNNSTAALLYILKNYYPESKTLQHFKVHRVAVSE